MDNTTRRLRLAAAVSALGTIIEREINEGVGICHLKELRGGRMVVVDPKSAEVFLALDRIRDAYRNILWYIDEAPQ